MTHENLFLVAAAIIRKQGKILIAKRSTGLAGIGKWEFPGGKVEFMEHPEECVVREVKEELDIDISVDKLYTVSSSFMKKDDKEYHVILLAFLTDYVSGEIVLTDHSEVEWVDIPQLAEFDVIETDKKVIKELIEESEKKKE